MDGLELPPDLVEILVGLGLTWPQAKEFALIGRGLRCLEFARDVSGYGEATVSAVAVMLASNHSAGLDAFRAYVDKVAGRTGYVFRSMMATALDGLVLVQAGQLVLQYKLWTMAALVSLAIVIVAAALAAVETAGTSLAVAAEYATEVYGCIILAQQLTEELLRKVGLPLSNEIARLVDVQIHRLQVRPIHRGPDGVHDVPTEQDEAERHETYGRRHAPMSYDPAHGEITDGGQREATIALGLESLGKMHHVGRDPTDERADFFDIEDDGTRTRWDVKTIPSWGVNPKVKRKHSYSDAHATALIEKKLRNGIRVVMDTRDLTVADRAALVALIRSRPDWSGKVIVY